jgi:hypothetical protein
MARSGQLPMLSGQLKDSVTSLLQGVAGAQQPPCCPEVAASIVALRHEGFSLRKIAKRLNSEGGAHADGLVTVEQASPTSTES